MIMLFLSLCELQLLKRPLLRHQCNERLSMEAGNRIKNGNLAIANKSQKANDSFGKVIDKHEVN